MPRFDQWGLLPAGHVGERGNPLMVDFDSSDGSEAEDFQEASEPREQEGKTPKRRRIQIVSSSDEDDGEGEVQSMPREGETAAREATTGGSSSGLHGESPTKAAAPPSLLRRKHWVARDE